MFAGTLRRRWLLGACVAIVAALEGTSRAAVPVGGEFQVNTFFTASQKFPEVAGVDDGAFVVVWMSSAQDGDDLGVFGQRYDSAGSKIGTEFQINTTTLDDQSYPKVAVDADGDFVVVWDARDSLMPFDVFGQRYSSAGVKLGGEFLVNSQTASGQYYPAVAMSATGAFVVVWASYGGQDGDYSGVFGQRFDSGGAKVGGEFQINTYTSLMQRTVAIATESSGDFAVTWDSSNDSDGSYGVRAQRFSSAGARLAVEFAVNSYTTDGQYGSALAMDADGDFVVVWTSFGQDLAATAGVFGQRYDSSGAKVGGEFQVNTFVPGGQFLPFIFSAPGAAAMDADGDFVVTWTSFAQDSSIFGAFGQRFSSAGARVGAEFQINTFFTSTQGRPAASMRADGGFVVVWFSGGAHDGNSYGIFGQRFGFGAGGGNTPTPTPDLTPMHTPTVTPSPTGPTPTSTSTPTVTTTVTPGGKKLDVDANGVVDALTDGLLILRRLFGFSGATLTSGAVGNGCARCDAGSIASYIDSLSTMMDIDDNEAVGALTDGLLILRRIFGFSGATLITGALGNGCMRCDAPSIASYIDGLSN